MIWWRRSRWVETEAPEVDVGAGETGRARPWLMLALFFLYTGVEVAAGQWAFTLLTEGRGMLTGVAVPESLHTWAGSRRVATLGVLGGRFDSSRILDASVLTAVVGTAVLWSNPEGMGAVGLPIAGLGFAAVFPTLVSVTSLRLGRLNSTNSMGRQMAAASLGAAAIPWLLGLLAEADGLDALGPGLFAACVALATVHFASDPRSNS